MQEIPRELFSFMLMWPILFAASSAACVWFRRRNRARHRRHLEGSKILMRKLTSICLLTSTVAERYLEHAVNISVEQQHLDPLQAALANQQRTPTAISYRVPLAVSDPATTLNVLSTFTSLFYLILGGSLCLFITRLLSKEKRK